MKIYSWKTLLVTILAGGGGLIYSILRLYHKDLWGAAWMLVFAIGIFKGIQASVTEKGYLQDIENGQKGKAAYKALFGKFAPIMPYGGLICFVAAAILLLALPMHIWIGLCFMIAAPVYQICLLIAVRKELNHLEDAGKTNIVEEHSMIHKRYADSSSPIINANIFKKSEDCLIQIYPGDQWFNEIFVDLKGHEKEFEELKPYLVLIAQNLWKMDCIVQKYSKDTKFAFDYEIGCIYLDLPDRIRLRYFGIKENTEFDVVFQHIEEDFILKSFGMIQDIPLDWDK